jgi:hypothetical protein
MTAISKMKLPLTIFSGALLLVMTWSSPAMQPCTYYFSGQITSKRAQASVFTGGIGGQFSGYFSYDLAAVPISGSYYPLLDFSIDGQELNVPNGTDIPFLPGIVILAPSAPGGMGMLEIRGFDLSAAAADPTDNGSTSLGFLDLRGRVVTNNTPPASLDLASFTDVRVTGPSFVSSPAPALQDKGMVTQLTMVPEPSSSALSGLGLIWTWHARRRRRALADAT